MKKKDLPDSVEILRTRVSLDEIVTFLDTELRTSAIKDYSCNGLQVEGTPEITRIAFAVDACMESYQQAIQNGCQMLVVHHGIIWDGIRSIRGPVRDHLSYLLYNKLNLYASHLPLDCHPHYGNNAGLAQILAAENLTPFGNYRGLEIGYEGTLPQLPLDTVVSLFSQKLDTECTVLPFGPENIGSVAFVSGGGGDTLTEAIAKKIDCLVTGEPIHQNYHAALEGKINVIYAGHYHTEKPGVQALATLCKKQFGIETLFLDIPSCI
ncbi:MAG TPA: Nif3-like dinuclear metal center hexameric protein [Chitinispirillaceae bacterium]|nr:Nif3-like dinuclear metal center hexameric protein [Chitinispirillaceae bacterium]